MTWFTERNLEDSVCPCLKYSRNYSVVEEKHANMTVVSSDTAMAYCPPPVLKVHRSTLPTACGTEAC